MNYAAVYEKDPFTVNFDIDKLKNGVYKITGQVSECLWADACAQMKIPNSGFCKVDMEVLKEGDRLIFSGHIATQMKRECVRTLELFDMDDSFEFKEEVSLFEKEDSEFMEVLNGSVLDMKEYIVQQIILHMNPYPIHPATLSAKEGEFDIRDGQEKRVQQEKEEKNPFSVLKGLKS